MLKHLTIEEMVALLAPLVGKGKRLKTFLSIKEVAPWHDDVEAAYQAVLAVRPVDTSRSPELRALDGQLVRADGQHDNLARATSFYLQGERALCLAAETPDTDRAAQCQRAYDLLFPDGLAIINLNYLAESGNTARIGKLLEKQAEVVSLLESIPVRGKKTLADTVDAWLAAGETLAELENKREEELAEQAVPASKANIQQARGQWLRLVSLILHNLEMSRAAPEAIEAIRGPIARASERAGKRYPTGNLETDVLDPESDPGAAGDGTGAPNDDKAAPAKKPA